MTRLAQLERDPNASEKQVLIDLFRRGHLNRLQLQACSKRYEELRAAGVANALDVVLEEFDAAKIRISETAAERARTPTIDEVPPGESPKQALVWLMQKGSLSPKETQAAAKLMTRFAEEGKPVRDLKGLRDILLIIGAARALPPGELEAFQQTLAEAARATQEPQEPQEPQEAVADPQAAEEAEAVTGEAPADKDQLAVIEEAVEQQPRRPGRAPRALRMRQRE